jgi:hypothetical protein
MYVELYRGRIANPLSQIPAVFENLQIPAGICAGICQIPVLPKYRRDMAFWWTLYLDPVPVHRSTLPPWTGSDRWTGCVLPSTCYIPGKCYVVRAIM